DAPLFAFLRKTLELMEAGIDYQVLTNIFEIMHIIFDYEKEMKFRPLAGQGEPTALLSHNPHFDDFLVEWDEMRKKHYNGEISDEELEDWKLSFPKKSQFLKK
ncbi:MAG: hypothetical protein ACFN4O_01785, partial [Anaeroglobus sp.]